MKKQLIVMVCAAATLSSCHIYKAYDRPDEITAEGIYRDPASATDTLAADTLPRCEVAGFDRRRTCQ